MHIKSWIERHKKLDFNLKREINSSFLNEIQKFKNNEEYYNKTENPAIFASIICYHNKELMFSLLNKFVNNLRMPGIHDDIKTSLLALKFNDVHKIKEYKSLLEYYRHNLSGKNNIIARIILMLYKLKFDNKASKFKLAGSIIQLILVYTDHKNAHINLMDLFRKEISFDSFNEFFKE